VNILNKILLCLTAIFIATGLHIYSADESEAIEESGVLHSVARALSASQAENGDERSLSSPAQSPAITVAATHSSEKTQAVNKEQPGNAVPTFEESVNGWIEQISGQARFEAWQGAKWKSYPLGPGTHSWVVLLYQEDQEVGYMVVSASPGGKYILSEYGTGENPLFSLQTLYHSLIRQELIPNHLNFNEFIEAQKNYAIERVYAGPMLAFWGLTINNEFLVLSAASGDQYPISATDLPKTASLNEAGVSAQDASVTGSLHLAAFDPYERLNWVQNEPLTVSRADDLVKLLSENTQITYTAEIIDETILIPLPIVGYHQWNDGNVYVIADEQYGLRFVPFQSLAETGFFYD
jgi:hypothetical protein